jgi:hypothetical protein
MIYSKSQRKRRRRRIREMRAMLISDVRIAEELGLCTQTIHRWCGPSPFPAGRGTVSVVPLQKAFHESATTSTDIARELGWYRRASGRSTIHPDGHRVLKQLGIAKYNPGAGKPMKYRERVDEATALRFARILHVDPWDLGL